MSRLAGAVVWAVVPAVPTAPLRLYAGLEHPPIELARPGKLIAAGRRGAENEFTFLVSATSCGLRSIASPPSADDRRGTSAGSLRRGEDDDIVPVSGVRSID